jgi:proton glutamate symport protein
MPSPRRILLGLIAGLAAGALLLASGAAAADRVAAIVEPVGSLWLNALRMTVIPLVLALLIVGVASAADAAASGGMAARAMAWFAGMLVAGVLLAAATTYLLLALWPVAPATAAAMRTGANAAAVPQLPSTAETLHAVVPSNIFAALAAGEMLPIVLFGLAFGFAAVRLPKERRAVILGMAQSVADTMMLIVKAVLWLAPLGVFALAFGVGYRTGFAAVGALIHYVLLMSVVLIVGMLVITYPLAVLVARVRLGTFASACLPPQVVAFSTQSSLASLPAMLESAQQRLGLPERASALVLPLAVALFRFTSPAGNFAVALFLAHLYGVELGFAQLAAGMAIAVVGSLGTVGVASSATFFVVTVPVCVAMGVPIELLPLLLAVELLPDLWRTVGNVTADLAVAAVVARSAPTTTA